MKTNIQGKTGTVLLLCQWMLADEIPLIGHVHRSKSVSLLPRRDDSKKLKTVSDLDLCAK
ncbi:MAG: hypothetical protein ACKO2G_10650 [Verrucomicrobiales bacterium]